MRKITFFSLLISAFFLILKTSPILAGGGAVQPINFAHAQQFPGKSFSPELAIKDPATNYTTFLVGKEYSIQAQGDLAGASCETTQAVSDSQGRIKANCKADAYGKFAFNVIEKQSSSVHAQFEVYFTENSTGFSDQGSTGAYSVSIPQRSFTTHLDRTFVLEAILKKDNQSVSNFDDLNYFRWEVLEGSITMVNSREAKNRIGEFKTNALGRTVVRVLAIMNDGTQHQSGAITITTEALSVPSPSAPSPQPSPQAQSTSPVSEATPTPTPKVKNAPSPNPSTRPDENFGLELQTLQQQVKEQQVQLDTLRNFVFTLNELISKFFSKN